MYHFRVHSVNWLGTLSTSGDFILATGGTPGGGSGGCVTPDPFSSMGGGTCWNGGWLPPGIAPPSGAVPPVLGPSLPSTPPANHGICANADPFAGMGGGVCWNGGWLPPGMVPPSVYNPPSAAPTPPVLGPSLPQIPAPSAPSGGGGCATSDPFSTLGGGTCWNGGWLPPGAPVPNVGNGGTGSSGNNGSGSTPTLPAPSAPTGPQPCVGSDPFSSIPGYRGTCVNGGWVPTRIGGI
jgi:hypothetical protein